MGGRCCINDLRNKEVINICDGRRLGFVIDVEVDICDGKLISIIVPGDAKPQLFGKCGELTIPWCKIERIGDDTILVNIGELVCRLEDCDDRKRKKHFFQL